MRILKEIRTTEICKRMLSKFLNHHDQCKMLMLLKGKKKLRGKSNEIEINCYRKSVLSIRISELFYFRNGTHLKTIKR